MNQSFARIGAWIKVGSIHLFGHRFPVRRERCEVGARASKRAFSSSAIVTCYSCSMGRKGWHERGYLPHFDGYDVAQHVVFRLPRFRSGRRNRGRRCPRSGHWVRGAWRSDLRGDRCPIFVVSRRTALFVGCLVRDAEPCPRSALDKAGLRVGNGGAFVEAVHSKPHQPGDESNRRSMGA
jgi:hypothetical protein